MSDQPKDNSPAVGEPPTAPADIPTESPTDAAAQWKEARDHEFERFYKERECWEKEKLDNEKSYDQLLVAISTLALGGLIAKDWSNRGGWVVACLVVAFLGFGGCLLMSLLHRYFTFSTHKNWMEVVDKHFGKWEPNAMERAGAEYDSIPFIKWVERLKIIAGGALLVGVVAAFVLMLVLTHAVPTTATAATPPSPNISQTVNVNTKP